MRAMSVVTVLLAVVPACADEIDELVSAELTRQRAPGAAVAVIRAGAVVKARGFGMANVEHGVPVRRETVFQTGSVGKQFTAVAAMLLVEDGKLKLDERISTYLPGTPESWKEITVRHLLTHTAGIREYTMLVNLREDYTEDQLLRKAYAFKTEFAAGTKWQYSNTGYAVLGILISKVSGKFYGDLMQERIFKPLGMTSTRIITEEDIIPHRAAGYRLVRGQLKNQEWVAPKVNTTGDGSLYVTLDDMIKWDAALTAGKVLKKSSYDLIWTPAKLKDGTSTNYGFGWMIETANGRRRVHHGGAWQGFTTYIDRYPDDKLTVIVLMNLSAPDGNPGRIAREIAVQIMPELKAPPK